MYAKNMIAVAVSAAALSFIPLQNANSFSSTITVNHLEAHLQQVSAPISNIILGDPSLVSINIIDQNRISLTGLRAGETNLIILDPNNETQLNAKIIVPVKAPAKNQITMHRPLASNQGSGMLQQTYICENSRCEPIPSIGDDISKLGSTSQYHGELDNISGVKELSIVSQ